MIQYSEAIFLLFLLILFARLSSDSKCEKKKKLHWALRTAVYECCSEYFIKWKSKQWKLKIYFGILILLHTIFVKLDIVLRILNSGWIIYLLDLFESVGYDIS